MSELGERISSPKFTIDQLADIFDTFSDKMLPHHLPAFYHAAAASPQNKVIDGILHVWNGRKIVLASDEELERHKNIVKAAEAELSERIGLKDPSLLEPIKEVVSSIQMLKRLQADGMRLNDPYIRRTNRDDTVDVFFRSVKEVAELTGETYQVYGNAFETSCAQISGDTDIMPILLQGFANDKRVSEQMARNPHLDDEYKALTSVDRLVETYGLGSAILEAQPYYS